MWNRKKTHLTASRLSEMTTHKLIRGRAPMGYPLSGILAFRWRSIDKVRFGVGGVFGTTGCQGTKNEGLGKKGLARHFL